MKTRVLELSIAFLLFVLLLPYSSLAVNSRRFVPPTALEQYALDPSLNISVAQFADLSIKDLQNMSHRKLRLEDKLAFKLTQRAIKRRLRKERPITLTMLRTIASISVAFCWGFPGNCRRFVSSFIR